MARGLCCVFLSVPRRVAPARAALDVFAVDGLDNPPKELGFWRCGEEGNGQSVCCGTHWLFLFY